MKGERTTVYIVHESFGGEVSIASAVGTVNGSQFRAPPGTNFGGAFRYAKRLDLAQVDRTPEAAVKNYVAAKRSQAHVLRSQARVHDELATAAQELLANAVPCQRDASGVVVDSDRERVLAYLRVAPDRDRLGSRHYPLVRSDIAIALEADGLVRLVDHRLADCEGGAWHVALLERDQ